MDESSEKAIKRYAMAHSHVCWGLNLIPTISLCAITENHPDSANDTKKLLAFFKVLKDEGFFNEKDPCVLLSFLLSTQGEQEAHHGVCS